jgi:hypothetical protein
MKKICKVKSNHPPKVAPMPVVWNLKMLKWRTYKRICNINKKHIKEVQFTNKDQLPKMKKWMISEENKEIEALVFSFIPEINKTPRKNINSKTSKHSKC